MTGTLFGIGTGPGDPELMTLKAVRQTKECDVIALPVSGKDVIKEPVLCEPGTCKKEILMGCVAYQIVLPNVPEMKEKPILITPMPMIKNKEELKVLHDSSAAYIAALLRKGKNIGFLTLGDPTVYSTYLYLHKRIQAMGLPASIINGVPSFCASAARLGTGLVENKEQLHILPSSYDIEEEVTLSGTKVLMKAGRKMAQVKEAVQTSGQTFYMVENCGMEDEKVYTDVKHVPDHPSYYSLIVLKEEE